MHDPEEDTEGKDVSLLAFVCLITSFVLDLRRDVGLCSLALNQVSVDGSSHTEVADLQLLIGANENIF